MSIRIELSHFRCWEKKTFTLPSQGMCLIHGRSGRGKSTLLNAIYYAITGKLKNITTFQKRSTTVRVEWPDLVVTRSRMPTKLVVIRNQQTYEEEAAQAVLDELFGAQFGATSYIDQDNSFSFVNLSPADKMEFLERAILEFQGRSVEKMRAHIRDQMSMVKLRHAELEGKCTTLEKVLSSMEKPELPVLKIETNVVQASTVDKLMEKLSSNWTVVDSNAKKSQNRIRKIEDQHEERMREQSRQHSIQQQLEEVERELVELADYADPEQMIHLQKRRDRLLHAQEALRAKEQWEITHRRLERLTNEHHLCLEQTENDRKACGDPVDPTRLSTLQEATRRWNELVELDNTLDGFDREDAQKELDELQRELVRLRSIRMKCPECDATLTYDPSSSRLIKSLELSSSLKQGHDVDTKTVERTLDEKQKRFHRLSALCDRYNQRFTELEEMLLPLEIEVDEDAIHSHLQDLQKRFDRQKEMDRALEKAHDTRHLREAQREEADARSRWESLQSAAGLSNEEEDETLHDLIRSCSVFGEKHQRVQRLHDRKRMLSSSSTSSSSSKTTTEDDGPNLQEERQKFELLLEKRDKYQRYLEEVKDWKSRWEKRKSFDEMEMQIHTAREQRQECMDQMRAWVKLREHLRAAEQQCMTEFVQSLNAHAAIYLEQFFDDDEIVVELKCIQPNEKDAKPTRSSILFEVLYRGNVSDLSSLSGGEKDRVNLAFTLALSELLHPSLLMLDECISSLDAETTSVVLETLKKTYKGKLVLLVSHQANLGWFDEVVEV